MALERGAPFLARRSVVFLAAGLAVLLGFLFRDFTVDDAFIAYRHARHVARGHGPVMNPGERVEGVSNLPWTLVLGAAARLGWEPDAAGPLLSMLGALLCVPLAAGVAGRVSGDRHVPGIAALATAAGAPLAAWGASGMETAAEAVLLLLLARRAGRPGGVGTGLLLGCIASLRPEGLVFAPAVVAAERARGAGAGARLLRAAAGLALVLAPLVLFRLVYYGDWLPNPARAKTPVGLASLAPGVLYLASFAVAFPLALVGLLASPHSPTAAFVRTASFVQLGFALIAGGDRFPGYRFAACVWPLLAVAFAGTVISPRRPRPRAALVLAALGMAVVAYPGGLLPVAERLADLGRLQLPVAAHAGRLAAEVRHAGSVLLGLALVLAWGVGARSDARRIGVVLAALVLPAAFDPQVRACRREDPAARYGRVVGEWLRENVPAGTLVATNAAGALPYASDLPVIDMLGLTDRHIARSQADVRRWVGHERGDGAYVLGRRPGIVILGGPEGSFEPWPFPGDEQLAGSVEFQRLYVPTRVPVGSFEFAFYRRADLAIPALQRSP